MPVGFFAPSYKYVSETYNRIREVLDPVVSASSKMEGVIRTATGGRVDFWSLENDRAGRSRKYRTVVLDEAAFTKPVEMMEVWERAIEPTLLDYDGTAWVLSNTNGVDQDNFLYAVCHDPKYGFVDYHAPSWSNPHVPLPKRDEDPAVYMVRREAYYKALRERTDPLVFKQEYEAAFVDWSGVAFFPLDRLLINGEPAPWPKSCDQVFAVIDTAVKSGKEHDGTAVSYWALSSRGGVPLVCLDYDVVQVDGSTVEEWIVGVFARLEELAVQCHALYGSGGAYIEDASAGAVMLPQWIERGYPVQALPSELTSAGKDARAINASGPVFRGEVKLTQPAYDKHVKFKGSTRNHMVSQVTGFRIGDRDAHKRADDLLDTFCYAVAVGLGNQEGYA